MNLKQILNNKKLSDKEKIKLMKEAYDEFLREIRKIEKERDEKITAIIKRIEARQLEKIRESIINL